MPANPTVFVVDDDPAVLDGIRMLLEEIDLTVETFTSARAFLDRVDADAPGCLVLDIRMPGMSGLELQRELVERTYALPIIIVSGHGHIPMAVSTVQHGALDFMEKPFSPQHLIDRVQQALGEDLHRREIGERRRHVRSRLATLTPREREILDRMLSGHSSRQIALDLALSHKTINNHRTHVMRKMGAGSVLDLVRMGQHLKGLDSLAGI